MKVEKLDTVAVNVNNLEEAIKLFSDLLEIEFVRVGELKFENPGPGEIKIEKTLYGTADASREQVRSKMAMDRTGYLELVETIPPLPEGLRNIHFKVPNMEEAKAEMKRKGIRLMLEIKLGTLKEAIYNPEDLHGVRLCLVEYDAPTLIDAIIQKPD